MNTHGLAAPTDNPQPAGPKKTLYQYFWVVERSTEGVGESTKAHLEITRHDPQIHSVQKV